MRGARASGNTAGQYRQYCLRSRGGHRPALDPRENSALGERTRPSARNHEDNAASGSIRDARTAGIQLATPVANTARIETATSSAGSPGETPNNRLAMDRPATNAPPTPIVTSMSVRDALCRVGGESQTEGDHHGARRPLAMPDSPTGARRLGKSRGGHHVHAVHDDADAVACKESKRI